MQNNINNILDTTIPIESYSKVKKSSTFLQLFKKQMWYALSLFSVLQCFLFPDIENIFAVICVLVSWGLTSKILLTKINLQKYTFSTIMILGFSITQFSLPIIFILLEGKPLVYNLKFPYTVFIHSTLALCIFLLAHFLYKSWRRSIGSIIYSQINLLFKKIDFFTPPPDIKIWLIGFMGVTGLALTFINGFSDEKRLDDGFVSKFLQGLIPYAYIPFFLLLKPLYDPTKTINRKLPYIKLGVYTLLLLVIGILGNTRSIFMLGVTSAGIAYFIGLLLGKFSYKIFTTRNIILMGLGIWLITGPLTNLGAAMVLVRSVRGETSTSELISKTVAAYQDKNALERFRALTKESIVNSDWDENYFDNIFLARFCNLKFNDASFEQAYKIGHIDHKMFEYSIDRIWAVFPQPVLTFLEVDINKKGLIGSSFGDYLFYRAGGSYALGGYRTGQFGGTGMAAFGWWYLLLLGAGVIPLFFLVDLFVVYTVHNNSFNNYFSLIGLVSITTFFTFFSVSTASESVINIYTFILRGWLQLIFIYWLISYLAGKINYLKK